MTKINRTIGMNKDVRESVVHFRDRLDCVMAEYGYVRGEDFKEMDGTIKVQTYGGISGEMVIYKFPVIEDNRAQLVCINEKNKQENFDVSISFKKVPENIACDFIREIVNYTPPVEEKKTENYDIQEVMGILKEPGETRGEFRKRLDDFLGYQGFKGEEFAISDDGDYLYKVYRGAEGKTIDATYAGDNIAEDHGFDAMLQENYYPYKSDLEDLVDAAIILDGFTIKERDDFYNKLEEKFII